MAKATLSILLCIAAMFCVYFNEVSADSGFATFYTPPYVPTACGITDPNKLPAGHRFAAASHAIWNGGAACGRKYKIACTGGTNQGVPHPCKGGSITVQVVDLCPGCQGSSFDLPKEAFSVIADPNEGKIKISYNRV